MIQAAGLRGVAEHFYTVFSTTTLSMIDVYAIVFLLLFSQTFHKMPFYAIFPRAAIDLLRQLKDKDEMSTYMVIDQVFAWIFNSL
jgi:hypothetical protein